MASFTLCTPETRELPEILLSGRAAVKGRSLQGRSLHSLFKNDSFPEHKRPDLGISVWLGLCYSGMRPLPVTTASQEHFRAWSGQPV